MREGIRLDAFIDPVCIATIGYGTIAYLDRRHVVKGDRIPQAAKYFTVKLVNLQLKSYRICKFSSDLVGIIDRRTMASFSQRSIVV